MLNVAQMSVIMLNVVATLLGTLPFSQLDILSTNKIIVLTSMVIWLDHVSGLLRLCLSIGVRLWNPCAKAQVRPR
jgi:hypothetical protein